ncbi:CoA-ligase [Musa troglodytarum]|uniref:CoA-ligase n=1 Tax=Musa troglodytarum TaxID=320322 RepID=A0A9E7EXT5_9LILI|nr:CoA-ligase [Musa troglodytarum]
MCSSLLRLFHLSSSPVRSSREERGGDLSRSSSPGLSPFGKTGRWQRQLRRLSVHEYQVYTPGQQRAELMSKHGINVPKGIAASSVEEAKEVARSVFPTRKRCVSCL